MIKEDRARQTDDPLVNTPGNCLAFTCLYGNLESTEHLLGKKIIKGIDCFKDFAAGLLLQEFVEVLCGG